MRKRNPEKVNSHGGVVCYQTLKCNSGLLCLDWREICAGIQHTMEGEDKENCDLLEMNQCDPDDEYRCVNGMCIPHEFFLDAEFGYLHWSDEIESKKSENCPLEIVSSECDDHLRSPDYRSCGDGQCIDDRLNFQRLITAMTCNSGRISKGEKMKIFSIVKNGGFVRKINDDVNLANALKSVGSMIGNWIVQMPRMNTFG